MREEDRRKKYKQVGYDRTDPDVNRAIRSQRRDADRRDARAEHYGLRRNLEEACQDDSLDHEDLQSQNLEEDSRNQTEAAVQKRLLQLEKWKEERNRKKLLEKKKAKPIFKVGVFHHRLYSPPSNKETSQASSKLCKTKEFSSQSDIPKRVTRATEKRLALKAVNKQQKKDDIKKNKEKNNLLPISNQNDAPFPFAPVDHEFKAPKGINALPMSNKMEKVPDTNDFKFLDKNMSIIESPKVSNKLGLVFPPSLDNHSFILAKSSTKLSSLRKSVLHKKMSDKQDSLNILEQDSMNNSSIESVVLKMSSDDQETLDDQENINCNVSRFSDATKYFIRRRSSRVLTPTESNVNHVETESTKENKEKDLSKNLRSSSRRSKRISVVPSTVDEEIMETDNDVGTELMEILNSEGKKKTKQYGKAANTNKKTFDMIEQNEGSDQVHDISSTNTPTESKAKSAKKNSLIKDELINDSKSDRIEHEALKIRRSSRTRKSDKVCIKMHAHIEIKKKSPNKRKSVLNNLESNKKTQTDNQDQDAKLKIVKKKHLLDISLSDNCKNSTRFTEVHPIVPDQSFIKFSPRRSVRPQVEPLQNLPDSNVPSMEISSPGKRVTYSLVSLSPLKNSLPTLDAPKESVSFELKSSSSPIKKENIKQNCSLNISLPKNSSPDRPPAYFSPYVVTSRGKSSIRKEVQKKRFSEVEEERTAQYYKHLLNQEIDRLNETCNTWNTIKESNELPEDIHYQIQAAIGHTNLLIRKKFERFRGLVVDCESGKGEMLVTCKDLQGFWEMMYREIKDCDSRFNKLENLKANNWVDEELEKMKEEEKKKKKIIKKPAPKKKPVPSKPSSLRAHILAARKKKLEEEGKESQNVEMTETKNAFTEKNEVQKNTPTPKITRRTSTPKSSSKHSSLYRKAVSKCNSPLIAMKISKMCKTPVVQLDESIIYINSDRTPAKGILKSTKDETIAVPKSSNKVIFKEQPMEVQEFDYDKGITEISDEEYEEPKQPTERKLNFENDSFNTSESEKNNETETLKFDQKNQTESSKADSPILGISPFNERSKEKSLQIPKIKIIAASPPISLSPLSSTLDIIAQKTKRHIQFKGVENETSRSTRSRSIPVRLTPKPKSKTHKKTEAEDLDMEIDDNHTTEPHVEKTEQKIEFYINDEGIITQRIVSDVKTPEYSTVKSKNLVQNSSKKIPPEERNSFAKKTTPKVKRTPRKTKSTILKESDVLSPRCGRQKSLRVKRLSTKT